MATGEGQKISSMQLILIHLLRVVLHLSVYRSKLIINKNQHHEKFLI